MALEKPRESLKIAVLVPCYKRPEYTKRCIKALEEAQEYHGVTFYMVDDASEDGTIDILRSFNPQALGHYKHIVKKEKNEGLRSIIIDFFGWAIKENFDFITIVGNDVLMPKNWMNGMLDAFERTDADVLSPNYLPSNPAYRFGKPDTEGKGYRPEPRIVGLWFMRTEVVKDILFERFKLWGIKGASRILTQIKIEKDPKIGWVTDVVAQDLGHWSGKHPDHIRSAEHLDYYAEVGRNLSIDYYKEAEKCIA